MRPLADAEARWFGAERRVTCCFPRVSLVPTQRSAARLLFAAAPLLLAGRAAARDPSWDPPLVLLPPPQAHDDASAPSPIQVEHAGDWTPKFPRPELALQTGVSVPFGTAFATALRDVGMGDVYNFQVPVWFEAGARLVPWLLISGYGSFALGGPAGDKKSRCAQAQPADACVATTARFGLAARVRLRAGERWMPWFGYAAGYEWTASDFVSASGPDYGHLSVGLDFRPAKDAALGLVVDFSLSQYESATDTPPQSTGQLPSDLTHGSSDNRRLHGWLLVGLRGAWTL